MTIFEINEENNIFCIFLIYIALVFVLHLYQFKIILLMFN